MSVTVVNLSPGDKISLGDHEAICVATVSPHPLYPRLWMVIWKVYPDKGEPYWSLDALSPYQEVGEYVRDPKFEYLGEYRHTCLEVALLSTTKAIEKMDRMEEAARVHGITQPKLIPRDGPPHPGNHSAWSPEPWEL